MPDTLLYQVGYFVGSKVKQFLGIKQLKQIVVDQANGTTESNGIDSPTSDFYKGLMTATQFYTSEITIRNSDNPYLHGTTTQILNQLYLKIDGSQNSSTFRFVFKPISTDNSIINKLMITNSHIIFESLEFDIDDSLTPDSVKDILATPFFIENSNVVFRNCVFKYLGDSQNVTFLTGVNSTIQLYNCKMDGTFTFAYGSNPEVPNLFIKSNVTISGNITIQDNDSMWIQYSNL